MLNDSGANPNRTMADFYPRRARVSNSTIGLTPEYTHMRMATTSTGLGSEAGGEEHGGGHRIRGQQGFHIQGSDAFNIPCRLRRRASPPVVHPVWQFWLHLLRCVHHIAPCRPNRKRLSAGFWLLTSYTFSKSLWVTNTPPQEAWYALSGDPRYQVPHSFAFSFGYELPFGKGKAGSVTRAAWSTARRADGSCRALRYSAAMPLPSPCAMSQHRRWRAAQHRFRKADNPTLAQWFDPPPSLPLPTRPWQRRPAYP